MDLIKLGQGEYANYAALVSKDQYTVYFTTDTHQIFLGAEEYTKSTLVLNAEPVEATEGDAHRLYAYNGSLWLCNGLKSGETNKYDWVRVANVNDYVGTVTSVAAGEGLETADGDAITVSGTIKHSVPSGATTVTDPTADATAAFGSTFAIQGVATDKFGHVTTSNTRTITMPTETPVTVDPQADGSETLAFGSTFAAITGIAIDASNNHEVETTQTIFTVPTIPAAVTYAIDSPAEGTVRLQDSDGGATTAVIDGWSDLAKKSDITAVFKFKGTKATAAELPAIAEVGDVWAVTEDTSEYVCTVASETGSPAATFEKLGPIVDLSAYATTAYVDSKLAWQTF